MRMARLGDIAEIERYGISPERILAGTPYLGLEHIEAGGRILSSEPVESGELASSKFQFGPDHLLYGKLRPYLAKIAMPDFAGICSTDILPVRPGPELDKHYLAYFLRQPSMVQFASSRSTGANLPRLSPTALADFRIPYPSLLEQQRIAAILGQAEAIRSKRRQALSFLVELGHAVFFEMFGDPVTNSKSLPKRKLSEFGSLDRGVSRHRPRNEPSLLGGVHPLIQTGDVSRAGDHIVEYSSTYSDLGLRQSKMWQKGTLCITIAANIADTAILGFDACFPDSVVGFIGKSEAINFFVHNWFRLTKGELERAAPVVAQKNINLAILRELDIIAPTDEEINDFYRRMKTIMQQAGLAELQMQHLNALFASLQHRAFRGEL